MADFQSPPGRRCPRGGHPGFSVLQAEADGADDGHVYGVHSQ